METNPEKSSSKNFFMDVRRKTRRIFTSEQKILIVMETIRREGSTAQMDIDRYYKW